MLKTMVGGFAILGVVATAGTLVYASQQERGNPQFTLPGRADLTVLELEQGGGMRTEVFSTAIYGDDRLVSSVRGASSNRSQTMRTVQLNRDRVRDVMSSAISAGLLELTHEEFRRKIESHPSFDPNAVTSDQGWVSIRFRVDGFGESARSVDSTFSCACSPYSLAREYPDIPEVVGLRDLIASMDSLAKKGD